MRAARQAFTLVELLVVLGIMSIVAMMVMPKISMTSADFKLTSATRSVAADLLWAQSRAISTQQNVYVIFTKGNGTTPDQYLIQRQGATDTGTLNPNPRTMGNPTATTNLSGVSLNMTSFTMKFDSRGQPSTTSAGVDTPLTDQMTLKFQSPDGTLASSLIVQPFTGAIVIP